MPSTDKKHLKLRGNVWWYQRRIPKELLEQFNGVTTIFESLGTGDIREARAKRDILNGKLEERKFHAPNSNRHRFLELVQSMAQDRDNFPETWDNHYYLEQPEWIVDENGERHEMEKPIDDEVFLHAYTTVNGRKDHRSKYKITLKEALTNWVKKHEKLKTKDTVQKIKKTVSNLLKYLNTYDIQLEDITKRQIHDYIELLLTTKAKATAQGEISRLRSIWTYCKSIGEVSGDSPFDDHAYVGGAEGTRKQSFTADDINWIKENVALDEPDKRLLVELGVFTGCRISELCNVRVKHIISEDNIVAIFIEKGKTDSATRIVPLTEGLGARIKSLAESKSENDLLLGVDGKAMSRWFSRIKTANLSTNTAKSFHSFRVMFATAMQRSEVSELKAAAILGHKRGSTMSYGYYSDGYTLVQLKEAYDQCVEKIIW
jgi:integrase